MHADIYKCVQACTFPHPHTLLQICWQSCNSFTTFVKSRAYAVGDAHLRAVLGVPNLHECKNDASLHNAHVIRYFAYVRIQVINAVFDQYRCTATDCVSVRHYHSWRRCARRNYLWARANTGWTWGDGTLTHVWYSYYNTLAPYFSSDLRFTSSDLYNLILMLPAHVNIFTNTI